MIRRLHPIAGTVALATVATFFTATALAELVGDGATILLVKTAILWGMLLLVPALATTGITGMRMGARSAHPRIVAKRRRMPFIALNGLLVLLPSAIALRAYAAAGDFGPAFLTIQAIELTAGAVNIALLGLSLRDGLILKGRLVPRTRTA